MQCKCILLLMKIASQNASLPEIRSAVEQYKKKDSLKGLIIIIMMMIIIIIIEAIETI